MRIYLYLLFVCLSALSCRSNNAEQTATFGSTKILVDESLAPIIEDQYLVFESGYPQAKIDLVYKPEIALLNILLRDSINLAIMSRELLPHEAKYYENKKITIRTNHIATDGVGLITNQQNKDTLITVDEIKKVMKGVATRKQFVFDNANSSTVRYLKELAQIKELPKQGVYALNNNEEVIKYVYNNPGAIGVIGINWMRQPTQKLEPIVKKLKIMAVKNSVGLPGSDKYYKPSQNNLALGLYPLSRKLYIINCSGGTGLGTGFAAFLASERGQRIMLKSGLLPAKIPSREIIIR